MRGSSHGGRGGVGGGGWGGGRGEEEAGAGEQAQAAVMLWSEQLSFSLGNQSEGPA